MDLKYDLMRHPAVRYTSDGRGAPYFHHPKQEAARYAGTPFFVPVSHEKQKEEVDEKTNLTPE